MNEVSQLLKEKRKSKKMTQREFANAIDMSFQTYTKIERGARNISKQSLLIISLALKIPMSKLKEMNK